MVTGATSQIGRFLLPRLRANDFDVVAVSRRPLSAAMALAGDGRWLEADVLDPAFAWPEADVLVHLAPLRVLPGILPGFFSAGGCRVICFGTTSRYSKAASVDGREQKFANSQIAAEGKIAVVCSEAGAAWTLFRPTLIYGCGMDRNVTLISRIVRRFGVFPLFGKAQGLRQPVHADDLAAACVKVIDERRSFGKAYDLVGGETLSYRAMVERIFAVQGKAPMFVSIPLGLFRVLMAVVALLPRFKDFNAEMARRMNEDLVFDSSEAARDFGYSPRSFEP